MNETNNVVPIRQPARGVMVMRGIPFSAAQMASGVGGFTCGTKTEYWYHSERMPAWLRPDFTGACKTAKTVTLSKRDTGNGANMDLDGELRPTEWLPRCIMANPFLCCAVNAVGLANKGLRWHLTEGSWDTWTEPFFLSLAAVKETRAERHKEWEQMFLLLARHAHNFKASYGVQVNIWCPNVEHTAGDRKELVDEAIDVIRLARAILGDRVPVVVKVSVQFTIPELQRIVGEPACDGLVLSNTIPWYDLPLWVRLLSFGTPFSPLRWRGIKQPGGYSGGFYLRKRVLKALKALRAAGVTKPIIMSGGITKVRHVDEAHKAGASAISFATVAILRFRRVQQIIRRALALVWQ